MISHAILSSPLRFNLAFLVTLTEASWNFKVLVCGLYVLKEK